MTAAATQNGVVIPNSPGWWTDRRSRVHLLSELAQYRVEHLLQVHPAVHVARV